MMKTNVDEFHKSQDDQNRRRAVAAGFHDDTTEQDDADLLKETIVATGMSMEKFTSNVLPGRSHMHSYGSQTVMKGTNTSDQRTC